MFKKNNQLVWPTTGPVAGDFTPAWKALASASGLLTSFPTLAFHMMVTFYLILIVVAIVAGEGGNSPSLMSFVLLWHLAAFPAWILKSLTMKLCQKPLGMLLCLTALVILLLLLQQNLILALLNIKAWAKNAVLAF